MTQEIWSAVDQFIDDKLGLADPILSAALSANAEGGLPAIDVTASQGKLLFLLARLAGARRILEIGTLGGYSTIWLARALPPDGKLITLEYEPSHADVAKSNVERAGFGNVVDIRVGAALDSLPVIEAEKGGPFDLFSSMRTR